MLFAWLAEVGTCPALTKVRGKGFAAWGDGFKFHLLHLLAT